MHTRTGEAARPGRQQGRWSRTAAAACVAVVVVVLTEAPASAAPTKRRNTRAPAAGQTSAGAPAGGQASRAGPGGSNGNIHASASGCTLTVSFFGFDSGPNTATVRVDAIPPTGGGTRFTDRFGASFPTRLRGNTFDARRSYNLSGSFAGITPQARQGYHVKVVATVVSTVGRPATKSKVLYLPCFRGRVGAAGVRAQGLTGSSGGRLGAQGVLGAGRSSGGRAATAVAHSHVPGSAQDANGAGAVRQRPGDGLAGGQLAHTGPGSVTGWLALAGLLCLGIGGACVHFGARRPAPALSARSLRSRCRWPLAAWRGRPGRWQRNRTAELPGTTSGGASSGSGAFAHAWASAGPARCVARLRHGGGRLRHAGPEPRQGGPNSQPRPHRRPCRRRSGTARVEPTAARQELRRGGAATGRLDPRCASRLADQRLTVAVAEGPGLYS